ncbi:DapH/DapD/GlmU-related protein [Blastopirellula sediminis]|uniref:DapH/DapD/GlmU-related protein n=1 Tax=Blastopirellula sediminis TaxID=2894196 RepID=UPI0028F40DA5|nr:DapH/DapD/GlmU-related protein [Blastopirellula sediminis]
MENRSNIFARLRSGEPVPMDDPGFSLVAEAVNRTFRLLIQLNGAADTDQVRSFLGELIGQQVDESTTLFPPLHTNYGRNITLGKNVFINHACSFLDLGGITIEDGVMIGPRVNITSENHPVEIQRRKSLAPREVVIKKNAWIGAGATILPGVTVGEDAVVAAGAVVTKDVPSGTVVGGIPAKHLKQIEDFEAAE